MARFILLSLFASAACVTAQTTSICDAYNNFIKTEADLTTFSQCINISRSLGIDRSFTSNATLPGPIYIKYFYAGNPGASHSTPTLGPSFVKGISLPDLESAGRFQISYAQYLESLSAPKLKSVESTFQIEGTAVEDLLFEGLERWGGDGYFGGNISSISLPSLKQARSLHVVSQKNLDCLELFDRVKGIEWTNGPQEAKSYPTFTCRSTLNDYDSPLGTLYAGETKAGGVERRRVAFRA